MVNVWAGVFSRISSLSKAGWASIKTLGRDRVSWPVGKEEWHGTITFRSVNYIYLSGGTIFSELILRVPEYCYNVLNLNKVMLPLYNFGSYFTKFSILQLVSFLKYIKLFLCFFFSSQPFFFFSPTSKSEACVTRGWWRVWIMQSFTYLCSRLRPRACGTWWLCRTTSSVTPFWLNLMTMMTVTAPCRERHWRYR